MNQEYQFDLRRDLQATIGGLNATLGLAYGMTQMVNLSTIGIKYLFQAVKFVFRRVFNLRNVINPIKFCMRLILGQDLFEKDKKKKSLDYLE